jgi:hypothetical protein
MVRLRRLSHDEPAVSADLLNSIRSTSRPLERASHLFLTSPSPYRTYSGMTPGYVRRYSTPYAYGEEWQAPTYRHERITPYGYERYVAPPAQGGYVVPRPVVIVPPR